jgi:hypothetical protein
MKSRKTIEQDLQEILVAYKIGKITLEEAVRVIMFEINKVRERNYWGGRGGNRKLEKGI